MALVIVLAGCLPGLGEATVRFQDPADDTLDVRIDVVEVSAAVVADGLLVTVTFADRVVDGTFAVVDIDLDGDASTGYDGTGVSDVLAHAQCRAGDGVGVDAVVTMVAHDEPATVVLWDGGSFGEAVTMVVADVAGSQLSVLVANAVLAGAPAFASGGPPGAQVVVGLPGPGIVDCAPRGVAVLPAF